LPPESAIIVQSSPKRVAKLIDLGRGIGPESKHAVEERAGLFLSSRAQKLATEKVESARVFRVSFDREPQRGDRLLAASETREVEPLREVSFGTLDSVESAQLQRRLVRAPAALKRPREEVARRRMFRFDGKHFPKEGLDLLAARETDLGEKVPGGDTEHGLRRMEG
jgi:hypothetical protein